MIFLKNYNTTLLSDYIRREYTDEEEELNLRTFKKITYKINCNYQLSRDMDLTYKEFVDEVLADLDLIEVSIDDLSMVASVTNLLISFLFRYLRENYYFDKSKRWLWDRVYNLYKTKNHDYNNSAEKQMKINGVDSYKNRLIDKVSRLYSYSYNRTLLVNEENIEETIGDLIGYCMIFLIWYEKGMPRYK